MSEENPENGAHPAATPPNRPTHAPHHEKKSRSAFPWVVGVGAVAATAGLAAGLFIAKTGDGEELAAAKKNTALALELSHRGYTHISHLGRLANGNIVATESANPADPKACSAEFFVDPTKFTLTLPQHDAAGNSIGEIKITDPQSEQAAIQEIVTMEQAAGKNCSAN